MLQQYISTGYYVNDCGNGIQPPITGIGVFTGFLDQCHADAQAYYLAIQQSLSLRESNPCLSISGATTTTTSTTTPSPIINLSSSGQISYDWTGNFRGEDEAYYDIVAWGNTNGYLSGMKYGSNNYISSISANDIGGYGVVLGVIKGSGTVTGFGSNVSNLLDIPHLSGVIQVSVGYDHCVALKSNGTITGWGRDNWGALRINNIISNAVKVCAGIGSTVILLDNGVITGTSTIGGGTSISYPTFSGFINIDHCNSHVLGLLNSGILTGFGSNSVGESQLTYISGIKDISAGLYCNMIVYDNGYITGYGTDEAIYNTPNIGNSGVKVMLKNHIGTVLKTNQDIQQWIGPWILESGNIILPSYISNNVVDISQGLNFTAAIVKRLATGNNNAYNITTGFNYLWRVTYVGGNQSYGGISIGDLYPPSGQVIQNCDNYSFFLPSISATGVSYTASGVTNCSSYGGTHEISFISILKQYPLFNINYGDGYISKTGYAATGITTGDYWNNISPYERSNKLLYYSDGSLSTLSGGWISLGTGYVGYLSHNDNMYRTYISGSGISTFGIKISGFNTGHYTVLAYGHGSGSGKISKISFFKNNTLISTQQTSSGINYNNAIFSGNNQYVQEDYKITNVNDYLYVLTSGFINGIQCIKLD